jgi:hypothetical protein
VAHSCDTDVKSSATKLKFEISPQNVSNAADTISLVNARNQAKTPLNVQTVTNNIQTTSQDLKQKQIIYRDHS